MDAYEPPEREDDVLRGRVVFTDGADLPLSYYRMGRAVERFEMDGVRFVPEQQPVDTTSGRGLLTAEQIADAVLDNFEEMHEKNYDRWEPSKFDWQAIADELNAALGRGECEVEERNSAWGGITRHCGNCGADLDCDTRNSPQTYCPRCGKAVRR